jgi:hypothetical protein
MLKVAPHELEDFEGHLFPDLRVGVFVLKGHVRFADVEDPARRDGDAEDIQRQIFQGLFTVA